MFSMNVNPYVLFVVAVVVFAIYQRRPRSRLPLPPGPKKAPFVGNYFQLPTSFEWETYAKWGSDLIHLDAAGTSIIIVNTHKAAVELFEKRSALYSSRVWSTMVYELVGWSWLFGFMAYGEPWRERRRLFQQHFHPNEIKIHQPREVEYTHKMLRRLLDSPERFMEHIRHMAGAITLALAYGIEIHDLNDPHIEIAEQALVGLAASAAPGAFLVDSIPILKYVPAWMPGAGFQKKAKEWSEWTRKLLEVPFAAAQKEIAGGTAKPSFVSLCLSSLNETRDVEHQKKVIKDTAGNFFVGGSDTTVSAINTFILAMTCYPEIQRRAQEEIDRVVAQGQLPDFEDEPSLPYLSAIVKEVLRWRAITPLAIPHYLTEDDDYDGYFLPAGSIVAGNAWAILHDKEEYPDPLEFRPERFLKDGKLNRDVREPTVAFGFGRRICPGRHIAVSTLWISAASILTVYDISIAMDVHGNPIVPTQEYISSMVMHPAPFKCSITPRSQEAERLILSLEDEASSSS
ncbi:hypothetical protein NLJ89_g7384 [Agrocybe chaxingu]|uniref:Cytochrome P450 n=1 Tax=Agrocybe chaxingu TaxID=84603 RepID=A0A9W8MTR5_9AGAR|nr:hypothetical protein NLJ89_g7384 [Agrocybe chaxingu]